MKNNSIYYSVGALLYCPANKTNIADSVIEGNLGSKYSLALCLEDTIKDGFVEEAENILIESINKIYKATHEKEFYLPKIFIRVRTAAQICSLAQALGKCIEIITGFILPKFSTANASDYIENIIKVNESNSKPLYAMPIYESSEIINLRKRYDVLYELKDSLSKIEDRILNIRVGGNDLCHLFGFRRHVDESIHDIKPVSSIFTDIVTVYGMDYVISGPVWEYYSGDNWENGLRHELSRDKLCGFTGKTAIHPNQISIINYAYMVSHSDYNDACAILNWNAGAGAYVSGSVSGNRMNEYKTHFNWAQKIMYLADAFGIKD